MTDLSRRDFFTRGLPGSVAALLGGGVAAAPVAAAEAAARPGAGDVSARDLRKMSRAEVREALRRIREQRRTR
jgi:NAD(P)H-hydrate repair Nnr-like enzyme with NAD(P)H-hydrate dehydratase domain